MENTCNKDFSHVEVNGDFLVLLGFGPSYEVNKHFAQLVFIEL